LAVAAGPVVESGVRRRGLSTKKDQPMPRAPASRDPSCPSPTGDNVIRCFDVDPVDVRLLVGAAGEFLEREARYRGFLAGPGRDSGLVDLLRSQAFGAALKLQEAVKATGLMAPGPIGSTITDKAEGIGTLCQGVRRLIAAIEDGPFTSRCWVMGVLQTGLYVPEGEAFHFDPTAVAEIELAVGFLRESPAPPTATPAEAARLDTDGGRRLPDSRSVAARTRPAKGSEDRMSLARENSMSISDTDAIGATAMPDRAPQAARQPRTPLPPFFPYAVGGVLIGDSPVDSDPWAREEAGKLAELASALLTQARTVADSVTPLSAGHALIMFRPALDRLAAHLTRWHAVRSEEGVGPVQAACNLPMALQTAIMRLAEAVQAAQDWDARQQHGRPVDPLPEAIVRTLEQVHAELPAMASSALFPAGKSTPPAAAPASAPEADEGSPARTAPTGEPAPPGEAAGINRDAVEDPLAWLHNALRDLGCIALQAAAAGSESVAGTHRASALRAVDGVVFGSALGAAREACVKAGTGLADMRRTLDAAQLAGANLLCCAGGEPRLDLRADAQAALLLLPELVDLREWIRNRRPADSPPAEPPGVPLTRPQPMSAWVRAFGCHRNTLRKRFQEQSIRNRKVGRWYAVAVSDLPPREQAKHLPPTS
jgi:hypothetical protein